MSSYINFSSGNTSSEPSNKLIILCHLNNVSRHPYSHKLLTLWNTMPILNLQLPLIFFVVEVKIENFC